MRIALAQLNPTVAAVRSNAALVADAAERADGADLVVTTELVISGYPPKDLLLREGFVAACDRAIDDLADRLRGGPAVLVGHPTTRGVPGGRVANAASLLADGEVIETVHKLLLPNYDVFDEQRYFRPGERPGLVEFAGRRLGVHICEDAWWSEPDTFYHDPAAGRDDPIAELAAAGADVLINLSASPFQIDKPDRRLDIARRHARQHSLPVVFANQVGGNDDLVFDGNSFVLDASGSTVLRLAGFAGDLQQVDLADLPDPLPDEPVVRESALLDALVLGLRDYLDKCGFSDCVLGLSGGIDSALTCVIAARAAGPEHVHAVLMPGRYSSDHSVTDSLRLAETLGVNHELVSIGNIHGAYEGVVGEDLLNQPSGLADQNLQARIRGALVMVKSNRHGWLPLATGNKSELAVGYCTLYGDMAGGFAVLCDVFKRDVYSVARFINEQLEGRELIPANILDKPPSAELAPDQFDQDTLPEYPVLDGILEELIEHERSAESLSGKYPPETVRWVAERLDRNEFKRRQMPPGIKLSARAFGSGRRMPMAARFEFDVDSGEA